MKFLEVLIVSLLLVVGIVGWLIRKAERIVGIAGPVAALLFCLATPARADIVLDNIAPNLTKCWGSTCLMPDAAVNAALFNLDSKKWEAGAVSLGGGAALLLWSDTAYASGPAVHVTGVLTNEPGKSSFAMPTVGLVIARYLQLGFSYRWASDGPSSSYLSVAGNLPWDLFTRATIPERAQMARAARGSDGQ